MRQLVLARSAMQAFKSMSFGANRGQIESTINADGLMRRVRYSEKGPFTALITNAAEDYTRLLKRAKMKAGGVHLGIL